MLVGCFPKYLLRRFRCDPDSFFFQAEDGIRVIGVTGVQTCALPISLPILKTRQAHPPGLQYRQRRRPDAERLRRSEERRVGKECRTRWCEYRKEKKEVLKKGWQQAFLEDVMCVHILPRVELSLVLNK